jgi:hypothetical protein
LRANFFKNFYFRNLLAIGLITAGYALYLLPQFLSVGGMKGFCMFRSITGIPCPGCGMGKASILLSQGELYSAFLMHPLAIPFAIAALAAIVWLIYDLIRKKESFLPLMTRKMKWPYFIVLMAVVTGVWGWNILKAF